MEKLSFQVLLFNFHNSLSLACFFNRADFEPYYCNSTQCVMIADLVPGSSASSLPQYFTLYGGAVYFSATTNTSARILHKVVSPWSSNDITTYPVPFSEPVPWS